MSKKYPKKLDQTFLADHFDRIRALPHLSPHLEDSLPHQICAESKFSHQGKPFSFPASCLTNIRPDKSSTDTTAERACQNFFTFNDLVSNMMYNKYPQ